MKEILAKYGYAPDKEAIERQLELIASNVESVVSDEVLKECFAYMDLTTLRNNDTPESVAKLVEKVNSFRIDYPEQNLKRAQAQLALFSDMMKHMEEMKAIVKNC